MRWTDDDETFTMSTVVTNAVCASDGKVVVHHNGNENLYNFMYALEPVDGKKFRIDLKLGNTLEGIPPGRYAVVVQAFYKREGTTGGNPVFERRQEVTITGNYKSIDVSLNAKYSRNSYPCGTGIMAFNASGGLGTSKYRFIMTQAPEGVSVPQDLKVKYINYPDKYFAVEGESYLPGDYAVVVTDGCGGDTLKFTIKELREVPQFTSGNNQYIWGWYGNTPPKGFDCSHVVVRAGLKAKTPANKDDVYKHYEKGFYEIAVVPKGKTPTEWHTKNISYSGVVADISPLRIDEVYSNPISLKKLLTVYVRVKGCPDLVESFDTGIEKGNIRLTPKLINTCMKYRTAPTMAASDSNPNALMVCFPMRIKIINSKTKEVITENLMMRSHTDVDSVDLDYNTHYLYEVYDPKGVLYSQGGFQQTSRLDKGITEVCGKMNVRIYDYHVFDACRPFNVQLYEERNNEFVLIQTVERSADYFQAFDGLSYNTNYKVVYDLPNVPEERRSYSFSASKAVPDLTFWPERRNLAIMNISVGGLSELQINSPRHVALEGPENFHFEWDAYRSNMTYTNTTYKGYFPKGKYRATVVDECGTHIIEGEYKEGYRTEGFRVETKYECNAMIVKPYGKVFLRGNKTFSTYFFITSGTAPFLRKDYREGEEIRLEHIGKYKLCIIDEVTNGYKGGIDTIDIDYSRPELTLDTDHTLAYACVDGEDGHIFVKGKTGVGQFHYTLWKVDEKGDTVMVRERETDVTNGIAHFQYGKAHDRVIVKVHDDCSNFKWYPLTISDRTNLKIASSPKPEICTGETIVLRCMKLSQDDDGYEWYDPSGKLISTKAEVEIPKADAKLSGNYRVVVHPLYCGNGIEGYVFIQVHPCFAPINPHLMQRCIQQKQ